VTWLLEGIWDAICAVLLVGLVVGWLVLLAARALITLITPRSART
jgi:hypothetical protein